MKHSIQHFVLITIIAATLIACGNQRADRAKLNVMSEAESSDVAVSAPKEPQFTTVANAPQLERKLIKTGQLAIDVKAIDETRKEVDKVCQDLKAYVSNENQNNYGDRIQQVITIRVDAGGFDALAKRIEALADKVESKNISVDDVTAEFIDVEARLKTKKELSERYHDILKQAKSVSDVLAVESQIGSVQAEIESMEGRLKYLRDQVSLSTLTLTIVQDLGVNFGFGHKFNRAIASGWDNLLAFIIVVINLWPFLILFGFGWWLYKVWRRRKVKV